MLPERIELRRQSALPALLNFLIRRTVLCGTLEWARLGAESYALGAGSSRPNPRRITDGAFLHSSKCGPSAGHYVVPATRHTQARSLVDSMSDFFAHKLRKPRKLLFAAAHAAIRTA